MDFLLLILWPLKIFAFHPILCGLVALVFTLPLLVSGYSIGRKVGLGVAALFFEIVPIS